MTETIVFLLRYGWEVLFLSVLAEQMGLPLPAAPVLIAMGAMAGNGQLPYAPAILLAVAASLIGDLFWYWLGVKRGSSILRLLCRISLEPDSCVRSTENMFLKYGANALLFAKFVPGLSTAAPPLAGLFRMNPGRFIVYDSAGALAWVLAYSGAGYIFRKQLDRAAEVLLGAGSWLLLLAGGLLAAYIVWKYVQRRRFYRELRVARITPEEVKRLMDSGEPLTIVDLRNQLEWEEEGARKIPGAIHMAFEEVGSQLDNVPLGREVILYCT